MPIAPTESSLGAWANGQTALTRMFVTPNVFSVHPVQVVSGGSLVGGASPTGYLCGFVSLPPLAYGSDVIVDPHTAFWAATLAGTVASVPDPFLLSIDTVILVANVAGTNVAHLAVASSLPAPITSLAYTTNFATATWNIDAGADLSAVGPVLSSAAGGIYSVWLGIQASWDS